MDFVSMLVRKRGPIIFWGSFYEDFWVSVRLQRFLGKDGLNFDQQRLLDGTDFPQIGGGPVRNRTIEHLQPSPFCNPKTIWVCLL